LTVSGRSRILGISTRIERSPNFNPKNPPVPASRKTLGERGRVPSGIATVEIIESMLPGSNEARNSRLSSLADFDRSQPE
jgi:hypothetical protein